MGMRIDNELDDNALNDDRVKQSNLLTVIEPYIGWSLDVPRAHWTLDYRSGFSSGYPLSVYDSRSQLLDTNFRFLPSKRLQVRMHESLLKTKNALDLLQGFGLAPASSVLDRPNNSIFTASQENSEQTGADVSYALTRRTVIGTSVAFYQVSYNSALDLRPIGSSASVGTHAFVSYQFTRHHWVGVDYNVDHLISQRPSSPSLVHSFLYTDTLYLRPGIALSFFGGSQHLLNHDGSNLSLFSGGDQHSTATNWTWAAGANLIWSSPRTNLTLGFSRHISDGAGLQGIVELLNFNAQIQREITGRWNAQALLSDDRNAALLPGVAPVSYVSVASGISRALNQKLSISCQYWYVHETSLALPFADSLSNHNRLSLSLSYNVKVPMQR